MNVWDNLWSKELCQEERKKHKLGNIGAAVVSCVDDSDKLSLINTLSIILYLLLVRECSIPVANLFHTSCAVPNDPIHSAGSTRVLRKVHAVLLAVCYCWEMCKLILSGYKGINSLITKGDGKDLLL